MNNQLNFANNMNTACAISYDSLPEVEAEAYAEVLIELGSYKSNRTFVTVDDLEGLRRNRRAKALLRFMKDEQIDLIYSGYIE